MEQIRTCEGIATPELRRGNSALRDRARGAGRPKLSANGEFCHPYEPVRVRPRFPSSRIGWEGLFGLWLPKLNREVRTRNWKRAPRASARRRTNLNPVCCLEYSKQIKVVKKGGKHVETNTFFWRPVPDYCAGGGGFGHQQRYRVASICRPARCRRCRTRGGNTR